jgi:hypothetical protein
MDKPVDFLAMFLARQAKWRWFLILRVMSAQDSETVFTVDDDKDARDCLQELLEIVGLHSAPFRTAQEFLSCPRGEGPSCRNFLLHLDKLRQGFGAHLFHTDFPQRHRWFSEFGFEHLFTGVVRKNSLR